jgi:hypothetical protein
MQADGGERILPRKELATKSSRETAHGDWFRGERMPPEDSPEEEK